jgi:hypothetical protein
MKPLNEMLGIYKKDKKAKDKPKSVRFFSNIDDLNEIHESLRADKETKMQT